MDWDPWLSSGKWAQARGLLWLPCMLPTMGIDLNAARPLIAFSAKCSLIPGAAVTCEHRWVWDTSPKHLPSEVPLSALVLLKRKYILFFEIFIKGLFSRL